MEEKSEKDQDLLGVVADVLPYIRFPLFSSREMTAYVTPARLLDQQQTIELFTYLASKEAAIAPLLAPTGAWLSRCKAHERRGRPAPLLFGFDKARKGSFVTVAGDDGTLGFSAASQVAD